MLPSMMTAQLLTRERYPTTLDHGQQTRDLSATPATLEFRGSVQPGTGTTDPLNREGAEVVYTIFTPNPLVDVHDRDLVAYASERYFVNGEPERWETGVLDHAVIRLSRWAG